MIWNTLKSSAFYTLTGALVFSQLWIGSTPRAWSYEPGQREGFQSVSSSGFTAYGYDIERLQDSFQLLLQNPQYDVATRTLLPEMIRFVKRYHEADSETQTRYREAQRVFESHIFNPLLRALITTYKLTQIPTNAPLTPLIFQATLSGAVEGAAHSEPVLDLNNSSERALLDRNSVEEILNEGTALLGFERELSHTTPSMRGSAGSNRPQNTHAQGFLTSITRSYLQRIENAKSVLQHENRSTLLESLSEGRRLLLQGYQELRSQRQALQTLSVWLAAPTASASQSEAAIQNAPEAQVILFSGLYRSALPIIQARFGYNVENCQANGYMTSLSDEEKETLLPIFHFMFQARGDYALEALEAKIENERLPHTSATRHDGCGYSRAQFWRAFLGDTFKAFYGLERLSDVENNWKALKARILSENPLLMTDALRSYPALGPGTPWSEEELRFTVQNMNPYESIGPEAYQEADLERALQEFSDSAQEQAQHLQSLQSQGWRGLSEIINLSPLIAWQVLALHPEYFAEYQEALTRERNRSLQEEIDGTTYLYLGIGLTLVGLLTFGIGFAIGGITATLLYAASTTLFLSLGVATTLHHGSAALRAFKRFQHLKRQLLLTETERSIAATFQRVDAELKRFVAHGTQALLAGAFTLIDLFALTRVVRSLPQLIRLRQSLVREGTFGAFTESDAVLKQVLTRRELRSHRQAAELETAVERLSGMSDEALERQVLDQARHSGQLELEPAMALLLREHRESLTTLLRQFYTEGNVFRGPGAILRFSGKVRLWLQRALRMDQAVYQLPRNSKLGAIIRAFTTGGGPNGIQRLPLVRFQEADDLYRFYGELLQMTRNAVSRTPTLGQALHRAAFEAPQIAEGSSKWRTFWQALFQNVKREEARSSQHWFELSMEHSRVIPTEAELRSFLSMDNGVGAMQRLQQSVERLPNGERIAELAGKFHFFMKVAFLASLSTLVRYSYADDFLAFAGETETLIETNATLSVASAQTEAHFADLARTHESLLEQDQNAAFRAECLGRREQCVNALSELLAAREDTAYVSALSVDQRVYLHDQIARYEAVLGSVQTAQ